MMTFQWILSTPIPVSYKEKLVSSQSPSISVHFSFSEDSFLPEDENIFNSEYFIPLSVDEKKRLYKPWEKSLIIKVFGRKVGYRYPLLKLTTMWSLTKDLTLIDLGNDFYLIKFKLDDNYIKVLHGRPWPKFSHN